MNSELILFLEENGFINAGYDEFKKKHYHQIAKEIKLYLYGFGYRDSYSTPEKISFEVHLDHSQYDPDRNYDMIVWIGIHNKENAELKIKRIINNLDEIIAVSLKEQEYTEYFDSDIHDMTLFSPDGLMLDLSKDEIKIIDNKVLQ